MGRGILLLSGRVGTGETALRWGDSSTLNRKALSALAGKKRKTGTAFSAVPWRIHTLIPRSIKDTPRLISTAQKAKVRSSRHQPPSTHQNQPRTTPETTPNDCDDMALLPQMKWAQVRCCQRRWRRCAAAWRRGAAPPGERRLPGQHSCGVALHSCGVAWVRAEGVAARRCVLARRPAVLVLQLRRAHWAPHGRVKVGAVLGGGGARHLTPPPLPAPQRKDKLFLTIDVQDCKDPKIELQDSGKLSFRGHAHSHATGASRAITAHSSTAPAPLTSSSPPPPRLAAPF